MAGETARKRPQSGVVQSGAFLGGFLIVAGLAVMVTGVRIATQKPRPANIGGALLAPLGLAIAFLGAARLLSPAFFGG